MFDRDLIKRALGAFLLSVVLITALRVALEPPEPEAVPSPAAQNAVAPAGADFEDPGEAIEKAFPGGSGGPGEPAESLKEEVPEEDKVAREIKDVVSRNESLFDIFKKHGLRIEELFSITEASASVHNLKRIRTRRPYTIRLDQDDSVRSLSYSIDDDSVLSVSRDQEGGFTAKKLDVPYEKRIRHLGGVIEDNLVSSLDDLLLALSLSDVFAWDIDFNTDLRNGDRFRIVAEALYLDGEFRKFGRILSAEFVNNKTTYRAYWFERNGVSGYYDDDGKSLRRAFLKAPLSFRRISSGYTNRRYHPILRRYRPHLGVDYAAPAGTPVSAPAAGTVVSRGYKGQNGRQIVIRHANGYRTYYGHLRSYAKGTKRGAKVNQGQVIGYVGSSGLSTGPHLDYRIKRNGKYINPLKLKAPRLQSLPDGMRAAFEGLKTRMGRRLASIKPGQPVPPDPERSG